MAQFDYTKMRINKKLSIVKCPDCGKHGHLSKYIDGSAMVIHTSHIEFGFNHVDTVCFFKQWQS